MINEDIHAEYRARLVDAEEAVRRIKPDGLLAIGLCMAEPQALLWALAARLFSDDLSSLRVFSGPAGAEAAASIFALELVDRVEALTHFVTPVDRNRIATGLNHYVPNHFHQLPRMITEKLDVDVAFLTVSPMDDEGWMSFGGAGVFNPAAARAARHLIVEVNDQLHHAHGPARVHVSEVTAIVENSHPAPVYPDMPPFPEDEIIARRIAELISDGDCLQIGVGAIPGAVCTHLTDRKDLGIHTEMLSGPMLDLVRAGVVTGARKTLHPSKHVYTIACGSPEQLALLADNPDFECHPVDYTNHPSVIGRNAQMVSINSILEVDLLGQANAEWLGTSQFSGTGGQLDFVRGAFDSEGGRSILAFRSTARGGEVSRVVPRFPAGTVVTTPRNDVEYLVTEHGIANLRGRSTAERVHAIVSIAHPDFRADLLRAAEDAYLL